VLTEAQNGFRVKKATETATQSFLESKQEAIDKGIHVIGIFFDLTKAYDVTNHDTLIAKLNLYSIHGKLNLWIKSYLQQQKQYVEIIQSDSRISTQNKYISLCREIKHGVPQGSFLGPLLFLPYIHDLPVNIQGATLVLFADDINLLLTEKNESALKNKIKNFMMELESWSYKNNLLINTEKIRAVSFHTKQNRNPLKPQVTFNNMDIGYKSKLKFLGTYITENLKWNVHVRYLSQKLSKVYYTIKSLKQVMSPHITRSVYHANFQSLLRYGILFLGGDNESIKIFKLQKRILRIMSGVSKHTSYREIFKDYSILKVACLCILDVVYYIKDTNNLWNKMHKFTNMKREENWIYMFILQYRSFQGKCNKQRN
jgi:hypothetical protein